MHNSLIKKIAQMVFSKEVKPGRRDHYQAELWVRSNIYSGKAAEWRPVDNEDPLLFHVHIDDHGRLRFTPGCKVRMQFHDESEYQFRPVRNAWRL